MSSSVLVILLLNLTLNLYTTQENLLQDTETKMLMTTEQIAVAVKQSQYSANYIERKIEDVLYMAAHMAAQTLDPDINNITNEELVRLSQELGVSHISLLVRDGTDITIAKSSDTLGIEQPTKESGLWKQTLFQLLNKQQVTTQEGHKRDYFWTGPFEYSSSSPELMDKWGFFYDGERNYIIDPYIRSTEINDYTKIISPNEVVKETLHINPQILEITGINPETFRNNNILLDRPDSHDLKLLNGSIRFGTYSYNSLEQDQQAIAEVIRTKEKVIFDKKIKGVKVIKSFVPIMTTSQDLYIISVVMDYATISSVTKDQLISNIWISLILLCIVILCSHIIAGIITSPIQHMLKKVNDVSDGRFNTSLAVKGNDELGLLANRINAMTHNINHNTEKLKQMVEENRSVKEHLESIINQTADAIHMLDLCENVMQVNKAFEELYGWKNEEVVGRALCFVPDFLEKEEEQRLKQMINGVQLPPIETIRLKKDGSTVEVSISTSPVRNVEGDIVSLISVSRDMTERNRMEELLRRSEKLTTVGQLAAGVAHEIRNPLTTLRGFMQLQQESMKLNPQHIDIMLSELDRINLIVSEFLILAKPQAVQFQEKDVRYILGDVVSLLDSQAHLMGIEFKYEFTDKPTMVHCEVNQLKQVFINVLKNAMEAMPQGGMITLHLFLSGVQHVGIAIKDEGVGIPEDMMPMLGEPFFSNKESGTGLGLMVSQRIIQAHKGMMEVKSELDKGTQITILLPSAICT
ncbi:two-component system, sporulation sensor kinase E [Paenibacillus sp. DS2015]